MHGGAVSVSAFTASRFCMPRDTLERTGNKSKNDFLPIVNIRLINLRGSADDCAYKSSAVGLAARANRGRIRDNARGGGGINAAPKDRTLFHGNLIRFASRLFRKKKKKTCTTKHEYTRVQTREKLLRSTDPLETPERKPRRMRYLSCSISFLLTWRIGMPFVASFFFPLRRGFLVRGFAHLPFVGSYRCL